MTQKYQPPRIDTNLHPLGSGAIRKLNLPLDKKSSPSVYDAPSDGPQTKVFAVTTIHSAMILLFIVSVFSPIFFVIGPLRLSPNRIVLALAILPCIALLLSGKLGRILAADIFVLAYGCLAGLSLFVNHGFAFAVEPAGSLFIEVVGSYVLARTIICNASGFLFFSKVVCWLLILILPLVLFESISNRSMIFEIAGKVFPVFQRTSDMGIRLGLFRAQGPFEHPILFGIVASAALSLGVSRIKKGSSVANRFFAIVPGTLATFFSLSSGSFLSVVLQAGILFWDWLLSAFHRRWLLLLLILLILFVAIDLASSRSPFHVFVTYLTFSTGSSYNRILIWDYGIAEVWRNPIFGIGLNDWIRAPWMSSSVDNFWLLRAMRHGVIAWICLASAVIYTLRSLAAIQKASTDDAKIASTGISLIVGLSVAIASVDLWNCSQSFFFFLLGSLGFLSNDDLRPDYDPVLGRVSAS